ncbi:hypothetical protein O3P69_011473 [Scylla paramamosain]|uniref:Uncharacterized protein n=1 Tax=Scylla paramamosain TaxID=85552 RepID=A0AAW0T863_SCYPA
MVGEGWESQGGRSIQVPRGLDLNRIHHLAYQSSVFTLRDSACLWGFGVVSLPRVRRSSPPSRCRNRRDVLAAPGPPLNPPSRPCTLHQHDGTEENTRRGLVHSATGTTLPTQALFLLSRRGPAGPLPPKQLRESFAEGPGRGRDAANRSLINLNTRGDGTDLPSPVATLLRQKKM